MNDTKTLHVSLLKKDKCKTCFSFDGLMIHLVLLLCVVVFCIWCGRIGLFVCVCVCVCVFLIWVVWVW